MMIDEKDWEAEEDARLMTRYQELIKDPKRYKKAISHLKKQALEIAAVLKKPEKK